MQSCGGIRNSPRRFGHGPAPTGFARSQSYAIDDAGQALGLALEQHGRGARITVNNVSNAPSDWLGRPVAWRAMPWREG